MKTRSIRVGNQSYPKLWWKLTSGGVDSSNGSNCMWFNYKVTRLSTFFAVNWLPVQRWSYHSRPYLNHDNSNHNNKRHLKTAISLALPWFGVLHMISSTANWNENVHISYSFVRMDAMLDWESVAHFFVTLPYSFIRNCTLEFSLKILTWDRKLFLLDWTSYPLNLTDINI